MQILRFISICRFFFLIIWWFFSLSWLVAEALTSFIGCCTATCFLKSFLHFTDIYPWLFCFYLIPSACFLTNAKWTIWFTWTRSISPSVCLLALFLSSIYIFTCYFVNMIFFPKSSVTVLLFSFAIYLGMHNLLLNFSSINSNTFQLICFTLTN